MTLLGPECDALGMHPPACTRGATAGLLLDRIQLTLLGITAVLLCTWLVFPVDMRLLAAEQLERSIEGLSRLFARTMHVWLREVRGEVRGQGDAARHGRTGVSGAPAHGHGTPEAIRRYQKGAQQPEATSPSPSASASASAASAAASAAAAAATAAVVVQRQTLRALLADLEASLIPQAALEPSGCGAPPFPAAATHALTAALAALLSELGTMHAAMGRLQTATAARLLPPLLLPLQHLELAISLSLQMLRRRLLLALATGAPGGGGLRSGARLRRSCAGGLLRALCRRAPWRPTWWPSAARAAALPRSASELPLASPLGTADEGMDVADGAQHGAWDDEGGASAVEAAEEVAACLASVRDALLVFEAGLHGDTNARLLEDRRRLERRSLERRRHDEAAPNTAVLSATPTTEPTTAFGTVLNAAVDPEAPPVSTADIMAFNALVHAVRAVVGHVGALAEAVEGVVLAAEPAVDLEAEAEAVAARRKGRRGQV